MFYSKLFVLLSVIIFVSGADYCSECEVFMNIVRGVILLVSDVGVDKEVFCGGYCNIFSGVLNCDNFTSNFSNVSQLFIDGSNITEVCRAPFFSYC